MSNRLTKLKVRIAITNRCHMYALFSCCLSLPSNRQQALSCDYRGTPVQNKSNNINRTWDYVGTGRDADT